MISTYVVPSSLLARTALPAYQPLRTEYHASCSRISGSIIEHSLSSENENNNKELSERKERTYQAIIGALLRLLQDESSPNRNQATIVQELVEKYKEKTTGFSKESLDDYFSQANKTLADKTKEKNPKQS